MARLMRGVDVALYAAWLKEKNIGDFESTARVDEKTAIVKEFLRQSRTSGGAFELRAAVSLPINLRQEEPWLGAGFYRLDTATQIGGSIDWAYQFDNMTSLSLGLLIVGGPVSYQQYSPDATLIGEGLNPSGAEMSLLAGLIIGNKTDSFAGMLGSGIGFMGVVTVPVRVGVYYNNFYIGYLGHYIAQHNQLIHGFEAGYSIFQGNKRIWPANRGL
jgi:hypothetical protein